MITKVETTASNCIESICFCNIFCQNSNLYVPSKEITICCITVAYTQTCRHPFLWSHNMKTLNISTLQIHQIYSTNLYARAAIYFHSFVSWQICVFSGLHCALGNCRVSIHIVFWEHLILQQSLKQDCSIYLQYVLVKWHPLYPILRNNVLLQYCGSHIYARTILCEATTLTTA